MKVLLMYCGGTATQDPWPEDYTWKIGSSEKAGGDGTDVVPWIGSRHHLENDSLAGSLCFSPTEIKTRKARERRLWEKYSGYILSVWEVNYYFPWLGLLFRPLLSPRHGMIVPCFGGNPTCSLVPGALYSGMRGFMAIRLYCHA